MKRWHLTAFACVAICTASFWPLLSELTLEPAQITSGPRWFAWLVSSMSKHLYTAVSFCLAAGLFTIVAAVSFLRRQLWARRGLEMLCWCSILTCAFVVMSRFPLKVDGD